MKKIMLLSMLLLMGVSIDAQKFLRYNMTNNTFYGIYTQNIKNLVHKEKNGKLFTIIYTDGKNYEIPVNKIESVSMESANINDGDVGEYRMYELSYENEDLKKVYVDNRACLLASKNGDFGANDEILFSSAYNDVLLLIRTDDSGRVSLISDGKIFWEFEYDNAGKVVIYNIDTGLGTAQVRTVKLEEDESSVVTSKGPLTNPLSSYEALNFTGDRALDLLLNNWTNIDALKNDPELHNQLLIIDGLAIGSDILSIGLSVAGGVPTGGLSLLDLGISVGSLFGNINTLINDRKPDYERIKEYCKHYQGKYNIALTTLPTTDVTSNSATIYATASADIELNGTFYFMLELHNNLAKEKSIKVETAKQQQSTSPFAYSFEEKAENLTPSTLYFPILYYECIVDGLRLSFRSDYDDFFITKNPDELCPDENHPHVIDLGLPSGTKWACCNVDAQSPSDYGQYYAWGETITKQEFDWTTYKWCTDGDKYTCIDLGDIGGVYGSDAAYHNMGNPWKMPSAMDFAELVDNCTSTWVTIKNVKGLLFQGENGNQIFLPAAGTSWNGQDRHEGTEGFYWSSTPSGTFEALRLHFNENSIDPKEAWNRGGGRSVRAVAK